MRKMILIFLLSLAPCFSWAADKPAPVFIEQLTWPEIRALQRNGVSTILIPTGGTEQNGPHIALGKHNRVVTYTSEQIARELGNALVAPTIAYVPEGRIDPPSRHMRFPGTISVTAATFANLLEDTARSFKQHGFALICFIGDHGPSQIVQQQVADRLNAQWKQEKVRVLNVSDYYARNEQNAYVEAHKIAVSKPEAHAGFFDTSEMLALDDTMLRPNEMKPFTEDDEEDTGAAGDPTSGTAEHGRALLALKIRAGVQQIRTAGGAPR